MSPRIGLIVDNFAGGGGASLGIEMAAWKGPDIAINHDAIALGLHEVNHPHTRHLVEDVWAIDPRAVTAGRHVALAWFSPDCKHFSKAKGGKPVEKHIRGLAWVVIRWAVSVRPTVIALENVEEFEDWGPLTDDGRPCPDRKGRTFNLFVRRLREAGYDVAWRRLRACDFGAPTIRQRLFLIARCDGRPIRWPEPSHGAPRSLGVASGDLKPWRTAAECIDWCLPCPSIFGRERPLAEKTLARIARGVKRFVIDAAQPFIVPVTHSGDLRSHPIDEPLRTITGAQRGEYSLVAPFFVPRHGERPTQEPRCKPVTEPMPVVTATANGASLVSPFLAPRYQEKEGQQPRTRSVELPLATITAGGNAGQLVAAFMAQHNLGATGHQVDAPLSTITGRGTQQNLVSAFMAKLHGSCRDGQDMRRPFPTVRAGGTHLAEVRAFLMKYYGSGGQLQDAREPLHTVPSKERFGLVTIAGVEWQIVDIGMRMLTPRELASAQGFPPGYVLDRLPDGTPITKTDQIRLIGNSVCPPVARAIIAANFGNEALLHSPAVPPRRARRLAAASITAGATP